MSAKPSSDRERGRPSGGILRVLARDTAGNTLAMMAAFMIPLAALAGSAVDMSRAYVVRVRLQQACDAGVLAGRKLMTVTSGTALDPSGTTTAADAAEAFFANNFSSGFMSTDALTANSFVASRTSDGQVTGTATVTMPMAIMRMFGFNQMTQTVTCNARLDVGDTDIMFVLDTTGSMACVTGSGCSSITTYTREDGTTGYYRVELANSKIAALRTAVSTFYNTLAASAPATAHIRYGFVPYASSVNVGRIIMDNSPAASGMPVNPGNPAYIVDNWTYQSRELATDLSSPTTTTPTGSNSSNYNVASGGYNQGDVNYGTIISTTDASPVPANKADCLALGTRMLGSTSYATGTWPSTGTLVRELPVWTTGPDRCRISKWNVRPMWRYKAVTHSTSGYKNSLSIPSVTTGTAVDDPSKITSATSKWVGCIEERDTTASSSFSQSSLPSDLDPDLVPSSDATRWRPMWPEVVYYRPGTATSTNSGSSTSPYGDTTNVGAGNDYTSPVQSFNASANYYACGKAAQRLQTMTLAQVQAYVAASGDFRALGYTYHDFGMIWGLRLLSPTGIWREDTAAWPGNNPPNRYIVFMSDGILQTHSSSYGTYGVEELDQRTTGGTLSNDTVHNARFQAVCTAAKAKNITIFVVAFDSALSTDMSNCATPGFAYTASDAAGLNTAFANIALQVAKLRLSQ